MNRLKACPSLIYPSGHIAGVFVFDVWLLHMSQAWHNPEGQRRRDKTFPPAAIGAVFWNIRPNISDRLKPLSGQGASFLLLVSRVDEFLGGFQGPLWAAIQTTRLPFSQHVSHMRICLHGLQYTTHAWQTLNADLLLLLLPTLMCRLCHIAKPEFEAQLILYSALADFNNVKALHICIDSLCGTSLARTFS